MADEYNDRIVHAARDMLKGTETAIASNQYIVEALTRLTARRRAQPEDDFTSHLVNHPAALTDGEIREHLRVVLIAAYEATANLLANVLRVILTDPRFRAQLNGGQMTVPEAVEQPCGTSRPSAAFSATTPSRTPSWAAGASARATDSCCWHRAGNASPRVRPTSPPTCRQPLPPRLRRRPARVPGPGHRPCHRRHRDRRTADASAGHPARLRGGRTAVDRVHRVAASGGAAGAVRAEAAAGHDPAAVAARHAASASRMAGHDARVGGHRSGPGGRSAGPAGALRCPGAAGTSRSVAAPGAVVAGRMSRGPVSSRPGAGPAQGWTAPNGPMTRTPSRPRASSH